MWRRFVLVACVFGLLAAVLIFGTNSNATTQTNRVASYPGIQSISVNVNESQSVTILVPVNNSASPFSWTDMNLRYINENPGIKITTDPLLFIKGPIGAHSDNYSISIGISVAGNASLGQFVIPFAFSARSSIYSPSVSAMADFNVIITVQKSQPEPFPIILLFPPVVLVTAATMVGIVLRWSKDWNLSVVKK